MPLLSLGISFRRASVDLLDRLAFTEDDLAKAYHGVGGLDGLDEAVILSTCNRVEVYGAVTGYHAGFLALKRLLVQTRGVDPDELVEPLYAHWEQQAADHLFGVAAGLDSMVLGETQIHAQVREALRAAEREGGAGPALTALFQAATRAGRRVRRETGLGAAPDAFVEIAADLADVRLGGLAGRDVVVVGAGQMAALAVQHLRARGVGPVRIVNRSLERARALAERASATPAALEHLPAALGHADLVVSATGAVARVIGIEDVRGAMASRPERPLVLVDLAVPRDVEPGCAEIEGVDVIDIATIRDRVEARSPRTADEIVRAQELVGEEVHRWVVRRRSDELAPLIRAIRTRGDEAVAAELDRWAGRLASLDPQEREAVEGLARGVAAKLLHEPIAELKERSGSNAGGRHAELLAELFGIELDEPPRD